MQIPKIEAIDVSVRFAREPQQTYQSMSHETAMPSAEFTAASDTKAADVKAIDWTSLLAFIKAIIDMFKK